MQLPEKKTLTESKEKKSLGLYINIYISISLTYKKAP